MNAKDLAPFHTSAATLASELTMRTNCEEAGFSDAEIDQMLIVYYVQQYFFRRWAIAAALLWLGLWLFGLVGVTWTAVLIAVAVAVVLQVLARIHARGAAKRHKWVRVKGGWTQR